MTVVVVAGNELGLQDVTLNAQGRQDLLGNVGLDNGSGLFINVATGNLVYTHQDSFLPSRGQDFDLIRTYNSRGTSSDPGQANDARWTLSTTITLKARNSDGQTYYEVSYGDGSVYEYYFDEPSGLYVTTDGEGAYETLAITSYKDDGVTPNSFGVTRADNSVLHFDKLGNLTKWTDANGVFMEFFYQSNRLVRVEDDTGHTVNYNYVKGTLVSITSTSAPTEEDPDGAENVLVEYRYDKGLLREVVDRQGHVTRYFYNKDNLLERIELPAEQGDKTFDARSITFTYATVNTTGGKGDNTPIIASVTDAEGNVTRFSYEFVGNSGKGKNNANFYAGGTTEVTDANGNQLKYTYDDRGNITEVLDQDGNATTYIYDDQDNLLSITDRRGSSTSFTYDGRGNLLSKTDAEGNTTTYTYTDFNKIASITEANQADAANPLSITFEYDDNFNLIKQTSALGDVTRYEYDGFGNLECEVAELLYDADGTVIGKQETRYFYDRFGNNIGTETAVGGGEAPIITGSKYDIFGNRTLFTDGNGHTTQFIYDNDNRLLQTIDPLNRITTFTYDAVGNVTTFTDAKGFQTVNVYDRNNNLLTSTELGDGTASRTVTRVYDVLGNVDSVTDAEGRVTTYTYSARNELVTITTAGVVNADADDEGPYTTSYGYDQEGNRVTIADARGNATAYEYNKNNQLAFETNAAGQRIQYAYDANTNLISVVAGVQLTDDLKRQQTSYEYDADNQLIGVTDAEGNRTAYTYDAVGNLASVTDARGNALAESDAEPIQDLREELGFARLVADLAEGDAEALRGYYTTRYEYDLANRLILEIQPEADEDGNPYTIAYRFDGNGNQVGVTDANGKTTTITFDAVNRNTVVLDANDIETRYTYDDNNNLTSLSIQDRNNLADLSKTTYGYNGFNQLIEEVDALGNALAESDALLYQELRENLGFARLVDDLAEGDAEALRGDYTTRYTYDLVDNLTSLTDREGRVIRYTYDSQNRLIEEVTAVGTDDEATRRFFYDGNDNLVRERDALNRETSYSYDEINRLTERADADGYITALGYDTFNNLVEEVTAARTEVARTTKYVYDLNNRLTKVTDPRGNAMTYRYDAVGNRAEVTDARGQSTDFEYDALNRLIVIRDPQSFETTFAYDGVGNQILITDARGAGTEMLYDPGNRLVKMTDREGRVTEYAYDAQANQISMTTAWGTADAQTTSYQYDAANNLRSITDAGEGESEGGVTEFGYDRVYNQTSVTDALGRTTTTTFDARNRVIQVEDALGGIKKFRLDVIGNILEVENAEQQVTLYTYNDNDRVLTETNAQGTVTEFSYHPDRELAAITRAAGTDEARSTSYHYDKNGNVVREENAEGGFQHFAYDENNNLIAKTDENGNQTLYLYDELSRVAAVVEGLIAADDASLLTEELGSDSWRAKIAELASDRAGTLANNRALANPANPSSNISTNVTEYEFDGNGNRTAIIDGNGNRTEFYFNAVNEQIAVVDALGFMTEYQYDGNGNITKEIRYATAVTSLPDRTAPNGAFALPDVADSAEDRSTRFKYDALNRVIEEYDANGVAETYGYDKVGNLKSVTDRNSNTTGYDYDNLNRLVLVTDSVGGTIATTFDALGNTLTRQDQLGRVVYYQYDNLNRLIRESDAVADGATDDAAYADVFDGTDETLVFTGFSYDKFGNLKSQTDKNGETTLYGYDALNRRTSEENALGHVTEYEYDAVGNLERVIDANQTDRRDTEEGYDAKATVYAYDALNRLIRVTDEMGRSNETEYDAVGNVTLEAAVDGTNTAFTYDAVNQRKTREILDEEAIGGRATLTIHYNAFGEETRREDATGVVVENRFNTLGQLDRRISDGVTTHYSYDLYGNLVKEERPGNEGSDDVRIVEYGYDALNRVDQTTDSYGESEAITYDAVGNILQRIDQRNNTFKQEFDANNRISRQIDRDGFVTSFTYDAMGNLLSAKSYQTRFTPGSFPEELTGEFHLTEYTYTALNQLQTTTDPEHLTTEYRYDRVGNLTQTLQYAAGSQVLGDEAQAFELKTQYNAANDIIEQTDALGVVTRFVIDEQTGQLKKKIENYKKIEGEAEYTGRETTYRYDQRGRVVREVAPNGLTTDYEYDLEGRIKRQILSDDGVGERITAFDYDDYGRKSTETDAVGSVTEYAYDAAGNISSVTYAKGADAGKDPDEPRTEYTESFKYDLNDRLIQKTDGEGWVTRFEYDERGNKTKTIQAFGTEDARETLYTYDGRDKLTSITDTLGNTTRYFYDQRGNQTVIERPNGTATQNSFDNMGRLLSNANGLGVVVFNDLGVAEVSFSDATTGGVTTNNTYDDRGNILSSSTGFANDPDSHRTTYYSYDQRDQLLSVTDPEGYTTRFQYDEFGNKVSVVNGLYELVEGDNGFDAEKALVARPQKTLFFYDAADNLTRTISGVGNIVDNAYDVFSDLRSVTVGRRLSEAETVGTVTIEASEDAEHISQTRYTYDKAGRITRRETGRADEPVVTGTVIEMTRDILGRQTEVSTLQGEDGGDQIWATTRSEYDTQGRIVVQYDALGFGTYYEYDALGNIIQTSQDKNQIGDRAIVTSSTFDAMNRVEYTVDAENNRTDFLYDDVGNLIQITDALGGIERRYYDEYNQLVAELSATGALTEFVRDAFGNALVTTQYAQLITDENLESRPLAVSSANDRSLIQTFNGNDKRTSEEFSDGSMRIYNFDSAGLLLTQVTTASTDSDRVARTATSNLADRTISWDWDQSGRLIKFLNSDGTEELYSYDSAGNRVSEESRVLANSLYGSGLANGTEEVARLTTFEYDIDNRVERQTTGTNEQIFEYDRAGNVIRKLNGRGEIGRITYDLNNRVSVTTDGVGAETRFAYDGVGNITELEDGAGNTTYYEHDLNGLTIQEVGPDTTLFSTDQGAGNGVSVTSYDYDALGRLIEKSQSAGSVNTSGEISLFGPTITTTRWYDEAGRVVAELDATNVLRNFTYTAFGELDTTATAYEEVGRISPDQPRPLLSNTDAATFQNFYDSRGNLTETRWTLSEDVSFTSLVGSGSDTSAEQTATNTVSDLIKYDAWGNVVETVDKNGNASYSFYDVINRLVAFVDADGFLLTTSYDSQGNVVDQTKYFDALTDVSASALPDTTGIGEEGMARVIRVYSAENYLIEEESGEIRSISGTVDPDNTNGDYSGTSSLVRNLTLYTYDEAGNQTSITTAAGTEEAQVEYRFYDLANRKIGIVAANGGLTTLSYNGNGKTTELRSYNTLAGSASTNSSITNVNSLLLALNVAANDSADSITRFQYNTANRLSRQTQIVDGGMANRVTTYEYDALGNMTRKTVIQNEGTDLVTTIDYDGAGRAIRTITPNGAYSFIEYNTFGYKVREWTGGDPNQVPPTISFTNASASGAQSSLVSVNGGAPANLSVSWQLSEDEPGTTSWIAWDTVSRAQASGIPSTGPGGRPEDLYDFATPASIDNQGASISLAEIDPDSEIFYRVVVRDRYGNYSWSAEQQVTVPVTVTGANVDFLGGNQYQITATFSGALDENGATLIVNGQEFAMTNGSATVEIEDPNTVEIGFSGTSAGGEAFSTSEGNIFFGAGGTQTIPGWLEWQLPRTADGFVGDGQLLLVGGAPLEDGDNYRSNNTLQVKIPDGSDGKPYDIYYGDVSDATGEVTLAFRTGLEASYSAPTYEYEKDSNGDFVLDDNGNKIVTNTSWTKSWASNATDRLQADIAIAFSAAEKAALSGYTVRFETLTKETDEARGGTLTWDGNVLKGTVNLADLSDHYLKIYYQNNEGDMIIQWLSFSTPDDEGASVPKPPSETIIADGDFTGDPSNTQDTGNRSQSSDPYGALNDIASQQINVLASETGGEIRETQGNLSTVPGYVTGPADVSIFAAVLSPATSGSEGSFKPADENTDISLRPYFTENIYDALGNKVATNEGDGLWRVFGVDRLGNRLKTTLLGDKPADTALENFLTGAGIVSYTHFDKRNNAIQDIAAPGSAGRAVTTRAYDYAGRLTLVQDPGNSSEQARVFSYDDIGHLVSEADALGNVTEHFYDRLGNRIRTQKPAETGSEQASDVQIFKYSYSGEYAGQLVEQYYVGLVGSTRETYTYDAFGRRTEITKVNAEGANATSAVEYNQAGEVVKFTDGANNVTEYWYDSRGNRTWTKDANGQFYGVRYNEIGKVTHEISFDGQPANLDAAKEASTNLSGSNLIVERTEYDIYGNVVATISAENKTTRRTYGAFGRLLSSGSTAYAYDHLGRRVGESSTQSLQLVTFNVFGASFSTTNFSLKSIDREYNAAGQLTKITDNRTGTRTEYTYNLQGKRATEKVWLSNDSESEPTRDVQYTYNARGDLTRWEDKAPGIYQEYAYYKDGNVKHIDSDGNTGGKRVAYVYDAADRVTNITRDASSTSFTYNYLGLRQTEGGVEYGYNKAGWLTTAGGSTWTYDKVGNVLTRSDGSTTETNVYDYAYRIVSTTKDGEETTTTFNKDGDITETVSGDATFTYAYSEQGLVTTITGTGPEKAKGSSSSSYDVNGRLTSISLGAGDDEKAITYKTFVYDNEGRIIKRDFNGGKDDSGVRYYLYADGNPIGEYEEGAAAAPTMNEGGYSVFQTLSVGFEDGESANPSSSVTQYTVTTGDTFRSLATQNYGSPDLWYVIAEANGMTGSEQLSAGTRLVIPNSANNVFQTAETYVQYNQGDIVGSKLPNLKTPPPPEEDECKKIGAIILIVVVSIAAIALTVVTAGAAAVAAAGVIGGTAGIVAGVFAGALVGAAIAAVASATTQGILIGFGLQEGFDTKAFTADVVAGAFGGAAAGLGAAVGAARVISLNLKIANVVGQVALETAGEAASQAIQNDGRVESPWLVAAAGLGGALGGWSDVAGRSVKTGGKFGLKTGEAAITKTFSKGGQALEAFGKIGKVADDLSTVEDVVAVARKAGKSTFGTFADAFRYGIADITGTTFRQTLFKGGDDLTGSGIKNLKKGQRVIRTLSKGKQGASTATFKVVTDSASASLTPIRFGAAAASAVSSFASKGVSKSGKLLYAAAAIPGAALGVAATTAYTALFITGKVLKGVKDAAFAAGRAAFAGVESAYDAAGEGVKLAKKGATATKDAAVRGFDAAKEGVEQLGGKITEAKKDFAKLSKAKKAGAILGGGLAVAASPVLAAGYVAVKGLEKGGQAALDGLSAAKSKLDQAYRAIPSWEQSKAYARTDLGSAKIQQWVADTGALGVTLFSFYQAEEEKAKNPNFNYQGSALRGSTVGRKGGLYLATNVTRGADFGKIAYRSYLNSTNVARGRIDRSILGVEVPFATEAGRQNNRATVNNYNFGVYFGEQLDSLKGLFSDDTGAGSNENYNDINARNTYADRHDRQNKYTPLRWFDVAASATSAIFSPLAIDRGAKPDNVLQGVRLAAGEVSEFTLNSIIAFAERSVGGVEGSASSKPSLLT